MEDLLITLTQDKEPYIKELTKDKIINLTGESGSGKSYYANQFRNNSNYVIVDTDELFKKNDDSNTTIKELRMFFKNKYGNNIPDLIIDFDICYKDIVSFFENSGKTIIVDSAQFRNTKDLSILKGTVIIMRTCIDTCYKRCIDRWIANNQQGSELEKENYKSKKKRVYDWYHSLNDFMIKIHDL